ncbi:cyclin-dependent kinase inhibitor 1C [Spea bombifrons]|uniref:cyclin-dependent kinase inhibitor 1C n=1 Tax=Spea bombifrons TaxID=233779 RepID=UPI002349CE26|nr:cyclin-dependent kinase inhibitor 1C [Spea bombifrons]
MCNVLRAEVALERLSANSTFPSQRRTVACRRLFGPVDHEELGQDLACRLREMQEESRRRWGFDFQRGAPAPGSSFVWEELRGDAVPAFYRDTDSSATPGDPTRSQERPKPRLPHKGGLRLGDPQKTALTVGTESIKRPLSTGQITDYFPVRKKTKDTKALCEKICTESSIPKDQTQRLRL